MDIKIYTKRELATAYLPSISPVAALNRLHSWIHGNHTLYEKLVQQTHYNDRCRYFTAEQVELIFEYLGPP